MSDLLDYLFAVDSTAEGTHWFTNNHITTVKLCRGSAIFSCDFGTRVFFFMEDAVVYRLALLFDFISMPPKQIM